MPSKYSKKSVRKTMSLPQRGTSVKDKSPETSIIVSGSGATKVDAGLASAGTAARARGMSPRVKLNPFTYQSDA